MKLLKFFNLLFLTYGQEDYEDDYEDEGKWKKEVDPRFALGEKGKITKIVTFEMTVNDGCLFF